MLRRVSCTWTCEDKKFSNEQEAAFQKLIKQFSQRIMHPGGFRYSIIISGGCDNYVMWYEAVACPKEKEIRKYVCKLLNQKPDKLKRNIDA